jgi:hypothetical protein
VKNDSDSERALENDSDFAAPSPQPRVPLVPALIDLLRVVPGSPDDIRRAVEPVIPPTDAGAGGRHFA